MCGIVGIFKDRQSKQKAIKSLEVILYRGSSEFELETFKDCTIGSNRLPIVDRDAGRQPKTNEAGSVFAVQNGEIYNYKKLKKDLIKKGHKFQTDSDTEVLVHLYEEYGEQMLKKIDSEMFAFIIYDKENDKVFAGRDYLGIKPMYYARNSAGALFFASELKQLSIFEEIEEINEFPKGCYFFNGEFKTYFGLQQTNNLNKERSIIRKLEKQIVDAVSKRVDTDLPIGVLLSGGVDSSMVMEIATRFHADVTAIILGFPGSPDYEAAIKLCQQRNYKYYVIRPKVDFGEEIDNLIYHLETYEPLIIRQSFSLDVCCREARRLGIKILLAGEGADELFAGYNEFSALPSEKINQGCLVLTDSLTAGHFMRIDRMSMKHTVEIRTPFFDKKILETAMNIQGSLKIKKQNHVVTTKHIFRKVAENFLPSYIVWRYKLPFSNGAGMNVGNNYKMQDGEVAQAVLEKAENIDIEQDLKEKYNIKTKEESYYFKKYKDFKFTKLSGGENRLIVKDNLIDLHVSDKQRLLVAEFDRLAAFFPIYFASEKGIFDLHNLDVDYIATGGDDRTYASLVNNSAHIGLSDPVFAIFENKEGVKGKIIGELVNRVINVAVSLDPNIEINELSDFSKYRIGTFQKYSTTHTIVNYFLPESTEIISFSHQDIIQQLVDRNIDIAILLPEQAYELEILGGHIVYDFQDLFKNYLFSGFTVSNLLEDKYQEYLKSFIVSVRESVRQILKDQKKAYKSFMRLFPELKARKEIFQEYIKSWSSTIKVEDSDYNNAKKVWQYNYPELLKNYQPFFRSFSKADSVIEVINSRKYRRDYPFLEDIIEERIEKVMENNNSLKLFGFWGASDKKEMDENDYATINYFNQYIEKIEKTLQLPVQVTWLLSDKHAELNGYKKTHYKKYLRDVAHLLSKYNYERIYLSELWDKWGISIKKIEKILKKKEKSWWNDVSIARQLEKQAQSFHNSKNFVEAAQKYYIMRTTEKEKLEEDFADSIFFAYGDGQMQPIFPTLPTIYLYTKKRGLSEPPWFSKTD